jgi:site-specific DNA recombinase
MSRPFAFLGRVSTEDQQDPESSRAWQIGRARALIEPHGGTIVAEYFDVGQSRSIPWQRRPRASALLAALRDPERGFDAVVIGEPQRAFYGNQFGLTFPLLVHYGVQLWVPEVGGPLDPDNEAHDLVMSVFGGMSKGERNRIKIRVRTAMAAQTAVDGRFLGGRPPYGYALDDAGPHPNPAKAADGKRLHVLVPDPNTAPIVRRIFAEYAAGNGLLAIAEGLTRDGILSPSAYDPGRNPHRHTTAWGKTAIRAILINPRYTGYQVWNKQRKVESLVDVDDVALGHTTRQTWNQTDAWIYSADPAHEALVDQVTFDAVQTRLRTAGHRSGGRTKPRASKRCYVLSGLLFCGICQRRMVGSFNNGRNNYRCVYAAQYAGANAIGHPRSLYVREDHILDRLDPWIATAFDPPNLTTTIEAMAKAQHTTTDANALAVAKSTLDSCRQRLDRYRAALEAGTDPQLIKTWIEAVQAERAAAEARIQAFTSRRPLTEAEITDLVASLDDITEMIKAAEPIDKAALYGDLGMKLTYAPAERLIRAEVDLSGSCISACRRGDLNPHAR